MRVLGWYWRAPKFVWGLFVLEFALTIPLLALMGIADPNTYRTKLWQEGSDLGFNSNPNEILYALANHRPINPPLIWSQFLTNYNVIISVLAMFLLLTKSTMMLMRVFVPPLSLIVHAILAALFAFSTFAQTSHDLSDKAHPNNGAPWYITHSCSIARTSLIKGYCQQAKASFALTVIMLSLFVFHMGWAVFCNFTGKKPVREPEEDEFAGNHRATGKGLSPESEETAEQQWEMHNFRSPGTTGGMKSPASMPFTPRTQAFHALGGGGDLPLRQQYS